ncbi:MULTISPECIES: autotransporter outer membrane beta-barrel domain-containing protein [unclassified Olleya]|jgi:outer membrane autotransporter protein|uniref:autotransporter outer membrane beta-barrel domain-containing protein n=1 Tax=unclassified Olleya TaxID=2615019 RepID=UPI0011AAC5EC|nr:autotransporter outer membrane beta-barrel domain-containing protein [Olleya sp. Hel_I_94]TVZ48664.1 outer membrane autotransporter protein [Olleya sp. Hel_I_94]|tara:strand:- start:24833 stop:25444 length:612 start_codon:yes stop_codon:yes gene_type:complete
MNIFKTLSILPLIILSLNCQAQDVFQAKTKGTFLTNGSILVYNTTRKINDNKATAFTTNITPKAGYFIADNLAIGLELSITTNKEKQEDEFFGDIETTTNGFAVLPFARYYLDNGIFAEAVVGFGSQKTSTESDFSELGTLETKASSFGFRVGVGYSFFLGDHVAIEPSINYSWEDINPEDAPSEYKETLSSIFLGIGLSAYF